MTEDEAEAWLAASFAVSRETSTLLGRFRLLVTEENARQNLVGPATLASFSARHIVDSAQLALLAPNAASWLDIGSGAGLPGVVIALLTGAHVHLVEPRRLRADFLARAVKDLGISAIVHSARVEALTPFKIDAISARAVAPLAELFAMGAPFAQDGTIWVLPKGKSAATELAKARTHWQGEVRIVPSVTDRDSGIVVAKGVRAK